MIYNIHVLNTFLYNMLMKHYVFYVFMLWSQEGLHNIAMVVLTLMNNT